MGQWVSLGHLRGPLRHKLVIERTRVEGSQYIATHANVVFEDEGEGRTEESVRSNKPVQRGTEVIQYLLHWKIQVVHVLYHEKLYLLKPIGILSIVGENIHSSSW